MMPTENQEETISPVPEESVTAPPDLSRIAQSIQDTQVTPEVPDVVQDAPQDDGNSEPAVQDALQPDPNPEGIPAFDTEQIDAQIETIGQDPNADKGVHLNIATPNTVKVITDAIQESDPNILLTASDEPKAEEPSPLPLEATTPLMPIADTPQHVQEPEQAIDVLDVAIEAFREAEEQSADYGYTPEQTFLYLFLPALTAKGLRITAIPQGQ